MEEQKVRLVQAWFLNGTSPNFWKVKNEISDPPTTGRGIVVLIEGEKRSTVFCPFSLRSWQVSHKSMEYTSAKDIPLDKAQITRVITEKWEQCVRLSQQADFGVAALVLSSIGADVPKFAPVLADGEEQKSRGGKEVDPANLRPINPNSKRGAVARFFLGGEPQSIHEAMARLGLTRSGVLSHLFTLNRDHGLGYDLANDCARLIVPEGHDPFVQQTNNDPSVATVASGRVGRGKPVDPAALRPIKPGSKRAAVAELFLAWGKVDDAAVRLSLTRSAVLSHLFTINKDNGLGYEFSPDGASVRLVVPEGHGVFG